MRYLLIGLALLAVTASFAATTATGTVSLTVAKFVSISGGDTATIALADNAQSGSGDLTFTYVANCAATITPVITASTNSTRAVWSVEAASPVGEPSGSIEVTVSVAAGVAGQLLAGSDSATVTATIVAD